MWRAIGLANTCIVEYQTKPARKPQSYACIKTLLTDEIVKILELLACPNVLIFIQGEEWDAMPRANSDPAEEEVATFSRPQCLACICRRVKRK